MRSRSTLATRMFCIASCCALALGLCVAAAQETPLGKLGATSPEITAQTRPLYESEPFDRITLDSANDHAVIEVEALDLPGRKLPENPSRTLKIEVRLRAKPEQPYELLWSAVERVEWFEDMVLAEARAKVAEGKLEEAYDYFQFLLASYPAWPGVAEAWGDYLYEDAKALAREKKPEAALAVLRELHAHKADYPGLDKALGVTTEALVEQQIGRGNHAAARALVENLAALFPEHATVRKWTAQFATEAARHKTEAEAALAAGNLSAAHEAARRMMATWPALAGAAELARTIREQYTRVVVGVSSLPTTLEPRSLDDWAARRAGRLVHRALMEYTGPGPEGGVYRCPVGEATYDPIEHRLALRLSQKVRWSDGSRLTGHAVARRLLELADPANPARQLQWAELLDQVGVRDVFLLDLRFRHACVRPEALLQTRLVSYAPSTGNEPTIGPYQIHARTADELVYVAQPQYFAAEQGQPQEIVERRFDDERDALTALRAGRIDMLDRVSPWQRSSLTEDGRFVVASYGTPLAHCLIPNLRKPLLANHSFRRALVYGVDREAILGYLLGGERLPGARVISGPFLPGLSFEDPLSYAYEERIDPRPYDPHMAIALANVALEAVAKGKPNRERSLAAIPPLVLAHPPSAVARLAAAEIRRHWELLGLKVELVQRDPALLHPVPDDVDLVYAELAPWEPVVDARALLGEEGRLGKCSPYMALALRQLDEAATWVDVRKKLRQIHRLAYDEAVMLPLWQMPDLLAHHRKIEGLVPSPVSLYQDVEQWRVAAEEDERP